MQATALIVISLLARGILADTSADNPTKENFIKLRNQVNALEGKVTDLQSSLASQQQCTEVCQKVEAELGQLRSTVQSMATDLSGVKEAQVAMEGDIKELEAKISELSSKLLLLADNIKRLTDRADLIAEDGSSANKVCAPGFYYSKEGVRCYKPILEALTWDQAKTRCQTEAQGQGTLVSVTDAGKNNAVIKLIEYVSRLGQNVYGRICNKSFWTAGRQLNDDCSNDFVWQPSSGVATPMAYTNWNWLEPSCGASRLEHCVYYGLEGTKGWSDAQCSAPMCAICEYRVV